MSAWLEEAGPRDSEGSNQSTRRCPACAELNVVKEGDFTCAVCEAPLPRAGGVTTGPARVDQA